MAVFVLFAFVGASWWFLYTHSPSATPTLPVETVELKGDSFDDFFSVKKKPAKIIYQSGKGPPEEGSGAARSGPVGRVMSVKKPEDERPSADRKAYKAFDDGDYVKAAILFKSAIADDPDNSALQMSLAATYASRGGALLSRKDYSAASDLFKKAVRIDGKSDYYIGLAAAYDGLGMDGDAVRTLERIRGKAGVGVRLKGLYLSLGNKSYKNGDYDSALSSFEKALVLDPFDKVVAREVRKLRKMSRDESDYRQKDASHFAVRYEGGTGSVAGHLVTILLEEAYLKVGVDLGYYPTDKVGAVLYPQEKFHDITRSPKWAGALYDGRIKIPSGGLTRRTAELEKVIFHEYTHAVVHRISGGRAPKWINEGLAQLEESKRSSDYLVLSREVASTKGFSLKQLEGSFMGLAGRDVSRAYAASLSATEYLRSEFGVRSIIMILEGVGKGLTTEEALFNVTYLTYDDLTRSWAAYVRR